MYVQYDACITAEQRVHKRSVLLYFGVIYSDSSNGAILDKSRSIRVISGLPVCVKFDTEITARRTKAFPFRICGRIFVTRPNL